MILGPELIIPGGIYCYTYVDDKYYKCAFLEDLFNYYGEYRGTYCWWLNLFCEEQDAFCLLWDSCKECSIKDAIWM